MYPIHISRKYLGKHTRVDLCECRLPQRPLCAPRRKNEITLFSIKRKTSNPKRRPSSSLNIRWATGNTLAAMWWQSTENTTNRKQTKNHAPKPISRAHTYKSGKKGKCVARRGKACGVRPDVLHCHKWIKCNQIWAIYLSTYLVRLSALGTSKFGFEYMGS